MKQNQQRKKENGYSWVKLLEKERKSNKTDIRITPMGRRNQRRPENSWKKCGCGTQGKKKYNYMMQKPIIDILNALYQMSSPNQLNDTVYA